MKIKRICKECGKEFEKYPSIIERGGGVFCSQECHYNWMRHNQKGKEHPLWKHITLICEQCGKEFEVTPSRKKTARFCSNECYSRWQLINRRKEQSPAWKGGGVIVTCKQCGKEFKVKTCNLKRTKFCSRKCKDEWQSKYRVGEKSANWKGGQIERCCKECNCLFSVDSNVVKKGHGLFCSQECHNKWRLKHTSEITKQKIREARIAQKGFPKHHTKPERIFEKICNTNNLPFKYTGDGSFWIGKNPAVNPDFVECNGKKIAVEIFSYWHDPIRRLGKVKYPATYEGRKKILKQYGWKLVVFWQEDLERKDAEQFILSTLKKVI